MTEHGRRHARRLRGTATHLTWVAACLVAIAACDSVDQELLDEPERPTGDAGRIDGGGESPGGTGGARAGSGGMAGGTAGSAGAAGSAGTGGSGEPDASAGCRPNPDEKNEVCPEICPEICNDEDDDCDRHIDEGNALCDLDHGTGACRDGRCILTGCKAGFRDCDRTTLNGCEAELATDVKHCGTCRNACNIAHAGVACVDGECEAIGCELGWDNCNKASPDCETKTNTLVHCTACDTPCLAFPHSTPTCESGACGVKACVGNFGNCDHLNQNGCETQLDTLEDCGACDVPCKKATCAGGVCSAAVCTGDDADCDKDEVTCEVDLATDVDHCGGCTNPCTFAVMTPHASLACVARACVAVCDFGWDDCDGDYATGCETAIDVAERCGGCDADCDVLLPETTVTACNTTSLTCEVVTCAADHGDCDGVHANGCETDLLTPENCGGCATLAENEVCSGLPEAATTTCATGACVIDTCNAGFADCDGVAANGCERDTTSLGPCLPDPSCTRFSYGDSDYYFCTAQKTWLDGNDLCKAQTRGRLVAIESSGENEFVRTHAATNVSIGAGDAAIEALWRWAINGVPFWLGGPTGSAAAGRYANWLAGEPGNTGAGAGEDCAELRQTDGKWNDIACSSGTRAFVCEEIPDRCPADASKIDPGQCGCGMPDADTDLDGFADCAEDCDTDPTKQTMGMCGCNVPDTDTDGDGAADCIDECDLDPDKQDEGACGCGIPDVDTDLDMTPDCDDDCPTDPLKTAEGQCGCGLADTDGDGDLVANCHDLCPVDAARSAPPCAPCTGAFSNITRGDYTYADDLVIGCNATYDSTGAGGGSFTVFGAGCTGAPTPVVTGGMVVLPVNSLTVSSGFTLKLVGDKPVILAVNGNATVNGTITAGATASTPGAGGNPSACTAANNGTVGPQYLNPYTSGSGGGGFRGAGGRGGPGWNNDATSLGGAGGTSSGNASGVPLHGGCKGANGYSGGNLGGAGGGAVQVSVGGDFTIGTTGRVAAPGGGGGGGTCNYCSGAGGGAGGTVLIEGEIAQAAGAFVTANGGAGGGGRFVANGTAGQDGHINDEVAATGGNATDDVNSSDGGAGGTSSSPNGVNGKNPTGNNYSAGGGGGGAGYVVVNGVYCGAQTVTVHNEGGGALSDYQVKLTLKSGDVLWTRVDPEGDDLRFTDTLGAELSYWIERWDYANRSAAVWIKVPSIPAGGTVQLHMNYGTGLPAASNLDATMIFGDDFSTSSGSLHWEKLRGGSEWNTSWGWSTCGLTIDGEVYCWGYNGEYAVGSGDAVDRWFPSRVAVPGYAIDMDAGRRNGIALTDDGQVWSWGLNSYNELGDGTVATRTTPVKVLGGVTGTTYLDSAVEVEAGGIHQFAILDSSELVSWGYNGNGTLGDGTNTQRPSPVKVVGGETSTTYLTGVVQVSAGGRTACALLNTGRVVCWGRNDWGQLGRGDASAADTNHTPSYVHNELNGTCTAANQSGCLDDIVEISVDMYNACARDSMGQAYCWGYGGYHVLGDGASTANVNYPVKVLDNANAVEADGDGVLDTCVSISVGARHAGCVLADGRVARWGGREEINPFAYATYPEVKSGGPNDFERVEAMSLLMCGIRTSGQGSCWGRNDYGGLGVGSNTQFIGATTDVATALPDRTKWTVDTTGMTVTGGVLRSVLNDSRVRSKTTFHNGTQPVVAETRFRVNTGPANGLAMNGFWSSTAAAFGLHASYNDGTTLYYRTNAAYNGGYAYAGSYKTDWTRSKITVGPSGASNAVGVVQRDLDGATPDTRAYTVNITDLPLMLGMRHDNGYLHEAGSVDWDHVFVRKYATVEPTVTLSN